MSEPRPTIQEFGPNDAWVPLAEVEVLLAQLAEANSVIDDVLRAQFGYEHRCGHFGNCQHCGKTACRRCAALDRVTYYNPTISLQANPFEVHENEHA
jgi:hypothetical protein